MAKIDKNKDVWNDPKTVKTIGEQIDEMTETQFNALCVKVIEDTVSNNKERSMMAHIVRRLTQTVGDLKAVVIMNKMQDAGH